MHTLLYFGVFKDVQIVHSLAPAPVPFIRPLYIISPVSTVNTSKTQAWFLICHDLSSQSSLGPHLLKLNKVEANERRPWP